MKIDAIERLNELLNYMRLCRIEDELSIDDFTITFRKNSLTIGDSYKIKDIEHMKMCLEYCDWVLEANTDFRVNKLKYIVEWKAHNLLYSLHVARNHTKDVDFERKEKWYRQLGYWVLYPISFWVGL